MCLFFFFFLQSLCVLFSGSAAARAHANQTADELKVVEADIRALRKFEKEAKAAAEEETLPFYGINIDDDKELAERYRIDTVPTVIYFQGGEPKDQFVGFVSYGDIKEFLEKNQIVFTDIAYAEDKLFNMQCYVCDAKYVFLQKQGYVYRRNTESISWKYHPESAKNWMKIAYTIKEWIEEKQKDMGMYKGLVQYTLFFASFFDGKMEYIQHKNSLRAVRKVLKNYGQDPLGKESFLELSKEKKLPELKQPLWRVIIRGFALGMRHQWYLFLSVGIKLVIDLKIDERLSDTGLRE